MVGIETLAQPNLVAEFDLAYRNRTQKHRAHLADAEITFQAMLRAGDLGVERVAAAGRLYQLSPDGFPAIVLAIWAPAPPSIYCAVENPEVIDLIAFRADDPGRWWYRIGGPGLILGEDYYLNAVDRDMPVKVFDSPLAWLQGNCEGACFLDDVETRWSAERYAEDDAALRAWWEAAA